MPALVRVEVRGKLEAHEQLRLLTLPEGTRIRILRRASRKVAMNAKKRISRQTDLSGARYPKRHKPRKDGRKMLAGLRGRLQVVKVTGTEAKIGFPNGRDGSIAAQQQNGGSQTATAAKAKAALGGGKAGMATRQQAKKLAELGAKWRRKGQGWAPKSQRWVMDNISVGQAGAVIRALGGGGKQSWRTQLPPRSFLGATDTEINELVRDAANAVLAKS